MDDEGTKAEKVSDKNRSEIYVLAIEILFAVIIGVSFTDYTKELVPFTFDFEAAMIFVAYTTVLASLIGYKITIKSRYHKNINRFVLDLILLYLYFQLVYSPKYDFGYFLGIYVWIFGTYVIWQILDNEEWGGKLWKRLIYSIPISVAFFVTWAYYNSLTTKIEIISMESERLNYEAITSTEWGILAVVFFLVIIFRIVSWKFK